MADTTVDTTTIDVGPTSTIDPATAIAVEPTQAVDPATSVDPATAVAPANTPTNEAVANTPIITPTPTPITTPEPLPTSSTSSITRTTISSSTFYTSGRPSSTTADGSPFSGPPPFLTAGGRPPFATGSGRPAFFDDEQPQALSAGAKAGIAVGVMALVFTLAAVVLLLWRMKNRKTEEEDDNLTPMDEPLPAYTEASSSSHKKVGSTSPVMGAKRKSAMKQVAQPAPILLDLHGSGSSTPVYGVSAQERRRSYVVEGSDQPLVLSIWEPANKSTTSLASSSNSSPKLGPAPPPKSQRKSNPGNRPRRKSNLAPVHEELPESRRRRSEDTGEGSSSAPHTPRTPRSAAFHTLTGGSAASSGQVSPIDASFSLEPMPPLPHDISPARSKFGDRK